MTCCAVSLLEIPSHGTFLLRVLSIIQSNPLLRDDRQRLAAEDAGFQDISDLLLNAVSYSCARMYNVSNLTRRYLCMSEQ